MFLPEPFTQEKHNQITDYRLVIVVSITSPPMAQAKITVSQVRKASGIFGW